MTIDSDSVQFSRSLKSVILLPVGVIFFTALALLLLVVWLFHAVKRSDHSYEVLGQTRTCEMLMINMESGIRGYLLEGNPLFLEPYNKALSHVDDAFDHLKNLVKDNPDQMIRADELIAAKNMWIEQGKSTIGQRQQNKIPGEDWNKMSKGLMDGLRLKFDRFTEVEEELHAERLKKVEDIKLSLGYAGSGLALILILTVAQTAYRQYAGLSANYRSALGTIEQRHAALMRSQADLEEQKEWFRVTLASIGDGVIVTDAEGRVVFMNHEAERLTGWNSIEALLQPLSAVFQIINEQTRAKVEDPMEKVLREKKVVGLANHTVLISRTGHEWPIEDSAAPIVDSKEKILGIVLVFHNASETRHAQNVLKAHSEDLEKKVAERTTTLQQTISELEAFSYTVSHDLRAPLRAMQGFSQAILEDHGDKLDEQGRNYLQRIKKGGERLDRLIQDLLSYTRISREDAPLVPLDLDVIVREIVEHYPDLRPPAVRIRIEGTLPKVWGREAALTQIISNLLGNAVKFVPQGSIPRIKVWCQDLGARVRLWIEDNGIGIAPGDHERIFQIFVQVNASQVYGGTGVGLAIVRKAARMMQGAVGVESEEGKGSRFWVELAKAC